MNPNLSPVMQLEITTRKTRALLHLLVTDFAHQGEHGIRNERVQDDLACGVQDLCKGVADELSACHLAVHDEWASRRLAELEAAPKKGGAK